MFRQRSGEVANGQCSGQGDPPMLLNGKRPLERMGSMRFFDNWWEYLPAVVRFARLVSLVLAIGAMVHGAPTAPHSSPLDDYWE
jgi:hypothetical protein